MAMSSSESTSSTSGRLLSSTSLPNSITGRLGNCSGEFVVVLLLSPVEGLWAGSSDSALLREIGGVVLLVDPGRLVLRRISRSLAKRAARLPGA
jgi:hypothetical protein